METTKYEQKVINQLDEIIKLQQEIIKAMKGEK